MTKTVRNSRSHEVEHLRKEVQRLTAALAAVKSQKDIYLLEIHEDDGETFTVNRTYYKVKQDAVNDLNVMKVRFVGDAGDGVLVEPKQVAKGKYDLVITREDGKVFRGTITRIKII